MGAGIDGTNCVGTCQSLNVYTLVLKPGDFVLLLQAGSKFVLIQGRDVVFHKYCHEGIAKIAGRDLTILLCFE